jgi:hypothetical protein
MSENKVLEKNVDNKEVKNSSFIDNRPKKPTAKDLQYEADRDKEIVTGVFKNHENPGETLKFWFRAHAGQDIEMIELRDGEMCHIPLSVARHLNKNCWYAVDKFAMDKNGMPTTEVGKKVRRFSFYTTSYTDLDDLSEVGTPYIAPKG